MTNCTGRNRLNQYFPEHFSEFDALLGQFLGPVTRRSGRDYFAPTSVWEEDAAYHVELDVPGVAREDVELTFDKGKLTISVERKAPEEKANHWHEERGYGKAIREVALSKLVDPATISAELTNGVLHVTVGKSPEAQPKRIEVK
ncbi:MAG: Hsp20/alpha crystallin family protein [Planctomycetes bacterium]|nr:Hsp20/alpha crystallin family protein [Planctomycetota bacterium]